MSKRTTLYRPLMKPKVEETIATILAHHAHGAGRQPRCSKPMRQEKAIRIAQTLHKSR